MVELLKNFATGLIIFACAFGAIALLFGLGYIIFSYSIVGWTIAIIFVLLCAIGVGAEYRSGSL